MQISTKHFFDISLSNMQKAQQEAAKSNEQLSTGKALVRPSDDTLKLRNIAKLEQAISNVEIYNSNINNLVSKLTLEESVVLAASDVLTRLKELAVQADSSTLRKSDKEVIAAEVVSLRDHLLSLANTVDADGKAIFGGAATDSLPFTESPNGRVIYVGDDQTIQIQVGENKSVSKSRSGLRVFDGVHREVENEGSRKVGFFDVIDDFEKHLLQPNKTQIVIPRGNISSDSGELTLNGIQISKDEDRPDVFEVMRRINAETARTHVFAYQNKAGDLVLENQQGFEGQDIVFGDASGLFPNLSGTYSAKEKSSSLDRSLSELDRLNENLAVSIGRLGSEMATAEYQKELNLDSEMRLKQLKSAEVDVDFAEAVSRFNMELARLEASQAAFGKLSRLSLFEYI